MSGGAGVQRIGGLNPGLSVSAAASLGSGAPSGFGGFGAAMSSLGPILAVYGALTGAVGSFYGAKSKQYELQSSALDLDYEASVANLNAQQSEELASDYLRAGEQAIAQRTLQGGLARSGQLAAHGARGIDAGVGSAAEVVASGDLVTEIDVLTINRNRVRAANEARMQAVNQRNQAQFAALGARNRRASARSIRPWSEALTSILGSAANFAGNSQSRLPSY